MVGVKTCHSLTTFVGYVTNFTFTINILLHLIIYSVQTCHKGSKTDAALKQVNITSDEDLDDYSVEISILVDCQHKNIVRLYEAFLYDSKLWVSCTSIC